MNFQKDNELKCIEAEKYLINLTKRFDKPICNFLDFVTKKEECLHKNTVALITIKHILIICLNKKFAQQLNVYSYNSLL